MNKVSKRIICILLICAFIIMNCVINTYAATEKEELIGILDEYRDDIGDIDEFESVIDKIYQDLSSATEINDELKQKLNEDIDELANVPDINPLILQVLDVELKSQVENLDESNVEEMKEELLIMKQWAESNGAGEDEPIDYEEPSDDDIDDDFIDDDDSSIQGSDTERNYSNTILPSAGKISTIIILAVIFILVINAIISKIKYGQFKGIK